MSLWWRTEGSVFNLTTDFSDLKYFRGMDLSALQFHAPLAYDLYDFEWKHCSSSWYLQIVFVFDSLILWMFDLMEFPVFCRNDFVVIYINEVGISCELWTLPFFLQWYQINSCICIWNVLNASNIKRHMEW